LRAAPARYINFHNTLRTLTTETPMPDLADGETHLMQGSGSKPYELKNVGGVYSCTCPAWRNQSVGIERRTCKHLRKLRGDAAEEARIGGALPVRAKPAAGEDDEGGPPVLLAERWDTTTDLSGWWMSEKLDGVRAYWDGKKFLSRNGNVYYAPDWFVEGLPDVPLDGELWLGRKKFQRAVSIARRQDKSDHWRELRYLVFDAPTQTGGFEERTAFIKDLFARTKLEFATGHAHELCRSLDHLRTELARIEALGGEGLMLRQPHSKYTVGRSTTLLKVKTFHDAEAKVIGHQAGEGRHRGRLGALFVELPNGTRFSVGTGFSDAERSAPPAVGSTITFRYQELSEGGVPRFPSYVGVRHDAAPPPAPAPAAKVEKPMEVRTAAAGKRSFVLVAGTSSKFWEVEVNGCEMTTRWGKIGTAGRSATKSFADASAARAAADKLVAEKTADGYVEK
jgi:DNA ligase-1